MTAPKRALFSDAVRRLNPSVLGAPIETASPVNVNPHKDRLERDLQADCERWLTLHGYMRMTADMAERENKTGWFGHWPEARRNPLTPDLMIFDPTMSRCLCVELKTRNVYQPGQKAMIDGGAWVECRTTREFMQAVVMWERMSKPVCFPMPPNVRM